jgi:hypothetical protein
MFGRAAAVALTGSPQFDGVINTPSRSLSVSTPEGFIVGMPEQVGDRTRIRIWTDHPAEPETITESTWRPDHCDQQSCSLIPTIGSTSTPRQEDD